MSCVTLGVISDNSGESIKIVHGCSRLTPKIQSCFCIGCKSWDRRQTAIAATGYNKYAMGHLVYIPLFLHLPKLV